MHNLETAIKETQQANVLQDTDASMYNSLESYSACVENTIKILMRQNAAFEHLAQTIIDVMKNMSNNSGAKG